MPPSEAHRDDRDEKMGRMARVQIRLAGDAKQLEHGISVLAEQLALQIHPDGLALQGVRRPGPLSVAWSAQGVEIAFERNIHFFRGIGLWLESLRRGEIEGRLEEPICFDANGAMFDVSHGGGVPRLDEFKRMLRMMALMGLNLILIYSEDSHEVPGEPYFCHMRSRYTQAELRALDDYADSLGIEMVPCIQTLAHLSDVLKWDAYDAYREDGDTLLPGDEPTLKWIEKLIVEAARPFRSRRIHLGLDEAFGLGKGRSHAHNQGRPQIDILCEHVERVTSIAQRHGLTPMMWDSMYFHPDYSDDYDVAEGMPARKLPGGIQHVCYDYVHENEDFYPEWLRQHLSAGLENTLFAGGIWGWIGPCIYYGKTFRQTNAALAAVKRAGIREVFVTTWGDGGSESLIPQALLGLALWAEHGYADRVDMDKLQRRFAFITGCQMDDFYAMEQIELIPGIAQHHPLYPVNLARCALWQDILLGQFDADLERADNPREHFRALASQYTACARRNGHYGDLFRWLAALMRALEIKADAGIQMRRAYLSGDRDALLHYAECLLPTLARRLNHARRVHRELWMKYYLPAGWEIQELRYAAAASRA